MEMAVDVTRSQDGHQARNVGARALLNPVSAQVRYAISVDM
jgi:hypothetical protein